MTTPQGTLADELASISGRCSLEADRETIIKAATELRRQAAAPQGREAWRCFHCNEVFTDADAAKEHFGPDTEWQAGCVDPLTKDEQERRKDQVDMYAELEREREENSRLTNRDYILGCYESDLAKHFNGAKSVHQAFLVLDAMEGRALAAEEKLAALTPAVAPDAAPQGREAFQKRVLNWLMECFSMEVCRDGVERNHRFLEEALELVQSLKCTRSEAHQLVDYVFNRPAGDPMQELGGVQVTLAALCFAHDLNMDEAAERELARVWTKIDKIREKQAAKPKHSPLPEALTPAVAPAAAPQGREALELADDLISELANKFYSIDPYTRAGTTEGARHDLAAIDKVKAKIRAALTPAVAGEKIEFRRQWIEQIRDQLFAMGQLPSGPLGDWAFLFREMLTDALASDPSDTLTSMPGELDPEQGGDRGAAGNEHRP